MKTIFISILAICFSANLVFPAVHTVNISSTNSCRQPNTGSATAIITGGTGPFSFIWTGPNGFTSNEQTIDSLYAGSYAVTVTDSSDTSIATATVQIYYSAPHVQLNSCGNQHYMSAYTYGGYTPYIYTWSTNPGVPDIETISGLTLGETYSVTVYDANGCSDSTSMMLTNAFNVSITTTSNTCSSNCNGTASINVTGNYPPFTYAFYNPNGSQNATNLCPGDYYVTISDSHNCSDTYIFNIADNSSTAPAVQIVVDSITQISCENNNDFGSIYLHATGGSSTFCYAWSTGSTQSYLTNLNPGSYTVTVTDSHGCSVIQYFSIYNTYNIYASAQIAPANCIQNGAISLNVSGLHPPFTFLWSDSNHQITPIASNLPAGGYNVTITDAIGCTIWRSFYVNSNCYNVIKGRVYSDLNQNCIQDAGELGIPNIQVYAASSYGTTNSNGDYTLYTYAMNTNVNLSNFQTLGYVYNCPGNGTIPVSFSNLSDTSFNNNFALIPTFPDLRISGAWNAAHPGFYKTYTLAGYNNSPYYSNATIQLEYDQRIQYAGCTLGGTNNAATHTIEWNTNSIPPWTLWYPSAYPQATFLIPTNMSINDSIFTCFRILPVSGDYFPADNERCFVSPISGSYDPNSIEVFPRGAGNEGAILQTDSVLEYTIHFQNTGNDTCFTVIINDTISQNLEPLSIIPEISSHPFTFTLENDNVLKFRFDNILLPDSGHNEFMSNGFVKYSIHTKPNLSVGTVINNTAYIYFDFNQPVQTNTAINTIISPLSVNEINNTIGVTIFPNPVVNKATVEINNFSTQGTYTFEIYNVLGKAVKSYSNIKTSQFEFDSQQMESGIYFYKLKDSKKEIANGKFVVE